MSVRAFQKLPTGCARAAIGHMPFAGHRSCETWFKQSALRPSKADKSKLAKIRIAKQYGYEPESLKASAR